MKESPKNRGLQYRSSLALMMQITFAKHRQLVDSTRDIHQEALNIIFIGIILKLTKLGSDDVYLYDDPS